MNCDTLKKKKGLETLQNSQIKGMKQKTMFVNMEIWTEDL